MGKKRKSVATHLDEVDRTLYSTFCSAANSFSQLYTQATNQQKVSFQVGERHGVEKVYQWIMRQHEDGSRVTTADIVSHLQNELDYGGEDASMSPRLQFQHQHSQPTMHVTNPSIQTPVLLGQVQIGHGPRAGHVDQSKNLIFSNALSSPVRWNLQPYHLDQAGEYCPNNVLPSGNGSQNHEEVGSPNQSREEIYSHGSNYTSMDMHSDSPARESY